MSNLSAEYLSCVGSRIMVRLAAVGAGAGVAAGSVLIVIIQTLANKYIPSSHCQSMYNR